MKISETIPKIYILGPPGSGKTTFIQKFLSKELMVFENLIVESSEMKIPQTFTKIYLILPERDELASRQHVENSDSDYFKWLDFYSKNKSVIDIKWVKKY